MSPLQLCSREDGARFLTLGNGSEKLLGCFESLRGRFSGPVVIIASGPSVKDFPMDRYRHLPMMAVNGSSVCFEGTGIAPLFYLCDDGDVAEKKISAVSSGMLAAQYVAMGFGALERVAQLQPDAILNSNLYLMERVNRWYGISRVSDRRFAWRERNNPEYEIAWSLFSQKRCSLGFSRNFSRGYFSARTIPYAALQLAYYLGFNQVFLVGLDMRPELGQFYDPQGKAVRSCLDEDYDSHIFPSFRLMSERVVDDSFRVYNMSGISRLPSSVAPKLSLAELDTLLSGDAK